MGGGENRILATTSARNVHPIVSQIIFIYKFKSIHKMHKLFRNGYTSVIGDTALDRYNSWANCISLKDKINCSTAGVTKVIYGKCF